MDTWQVKDGLFKTGWRKAKASDAIVTVKFIVVSISFVHRMIKNHSLTNTQLYRVLNNSFSPIGSRGELSIAVARPLKNPQ